MVKINSGIFNSYLAIKIIFKTGIFNDGEAINNGKSTIILTIIISRGGAIEDFYFLLHILLYSPPL